MQKNAMRGGAYSVVITAVVLAILVAVNVFFSALPASSTEYDISASKLYSVTSNTRSVVSALTEDVTIYWIVQAGEEDAVIEKLLDRYESLSDHITVEKRNPDVYPTFAEQYTDGTVYNNSLVVECGDRSRYISNTDIYLTDASLYGDSVAYLRVGDSPIVYEISYDTFRQVMACSYDDLRHSQVLPAEFEHVQRLEISLDGQQYTLTRTQEADGDEPAVWTWDGEEIEISGVEDALTALEITQFTADAAGGETEISLTAVLDLEDEPEVRITLYRADGESCRASVDGESIGSLPRSQVVDLIEAVHAIVLN